jgi:hypothetical protein
MIKVHVWNFRGLKSAMGHASMHLGVEYISWWPNNSADPRSVNARNFKLPGAMGRKIPLYSVPHIHGQSFQNDMDYESVDGIKPKAPDHTVELTGLDEKRVTAWWHEFNVPKRNWSTLGQNCATTVGRALMVGGGDDYCEGVEGWWDSWNAVWQPNDVLNYARQIEQGLKKHAGMHAAINLVRRFSKSPLAMTSVTSSMDEAGLAKAIYSEVGPNTVEVAKVFQILNSRRNSDADDVAEIYVKLLQANKGAALAAVSKDKSLQNLLIKVLDEGWTSAGEKQAIAFLRSLA